MVLPSEFELSVTPEEIVLRARGQRRERLDLYLLRRLRWGSRTKVQRLIQLGRVLVNGGPGKCAQRIARGDEVRVRLLTSTAIRSEHPPLSAPLWEDPYLLAIAKPPHRLVHPTGRTIAGTVIDELHSRYQELNLRGGREVIPRLCHRLDRDTSGLLLVAKTIEIRRRVQEAFEGDRVRKGYIAIVEGEARERAFEVDAAISAHFDLRRPHSHRLARLDESGKASKTRFFVLGCGAGFSVVHCLPITGRQNQIRVHLASVGLPILGDTGFGSAEEKWTAPAPAYPDRALLHSYQLRFRHPLWGTERELRCPAIGDLRPFLMAAGVMESEIPPLLRVGR